MKFPLALFWRELTHFLPGRRVASWEEVHSVEEGTDTVVLVSGFGSPQRTLSVIRRRLLREGYHVLVVPLDWKSLGEGIQGLRGSAHNLAEVMGSHLRQPGTHPERTFLVAHSAGGLVARYYVQRLGGHLACRGLVTLATPHRGTWLALAGLLTHLVVRARCLLQMVPGSPFLRDLNRVTLPEGLPFQSFASREDPICPPRAARLPRGWAKQPRVRSEELRHLSHTDFLLRKRAYRILRQALDSMGSAPKPRRRLREAG